MMNEEWKPRHLEARKFTCGYCGAYVGSEKGFESIPILFGTPIETPSQFIYLCPLCECPNFFKGEIQTPAPIFGSEVAAVPDLINKLYTEARVCFSNNAFTATTLCCRKILMHIAVEKGAQEGRKFVEYVNYLSSEGYIARDCQEWVDHIRGKGNEATHEIKLMTKADAMELIQFVEMLLKQMYEFPAKLKKRDVPP